MWNISIAFFHLFNLNYQETRDLYIFAKSRKNQTIMIFINMIDTPNSFCCFQLHKVEYDSERIKKCHQN